MNRSELDRLEDRLRDAVTPQDLTLLDRYRRGFRVAYDTVVDRIRTELLLEVSGRPAKSTSAIVDKLRRGTMRFRQMQDIAGCRTVVPSIADQDLLTQSLAGMFDVAIVDRRAQPSHGYRAVHLVTRGTTLPVEIQIRTDLQHAWAELSEKFADRFGIALKYGGGPPEIRRTVKIAVSTI
jgi:putative GTP pyrophosphokinase